MLVFGALWGQGCPRSDVIRDIRCSALDVGRSMFHGGREAWTPNDADKAVRAPFTDDWRRLLLRSLAHATTSVSRPQLLVHLFRRSNHSNSRSIRRVGAPGLHNARFWAPCRPRALTRRLNEHL